LNALPKRFQPIPLQCNRAWGEIVGTGHIRTVPEDFQVVEVPLVTPGGEGEHSWLCVRKRNSNTQWVARQLARFAEVPLSAVSYAGLKDRHAVTEQWFSVQLAGRNDPDWSALQAPDFEVLSATRHQRKLKTGTLRGNRFKLCIRDVSAAHSALQQRLEQIPQLFWHTAFRASG
jgi:tRNA pseudouridine13 synthase